jgi:hypothetical protein
MLRLVRYDQQNRQINSTRVLMLQHRQPSPNSHVYAPHAYEHEPCPPLEGLCIGATRIKPLQHTRALQSEISTLQ